MSTLVSSITTIKYQFISSYLAVTGQIVRSHDWKRKTSDYLKIQLATESVGVPRACWVCAWGGGHAACTLSAAIAPKMVCSYVNNTRVGS